MRDLRWAGLHKRASAAIALAALATSCVALRANAQQAQQQFPDAPSTQLARIANSSSTVDPDVQPGADAGDGFGQNTVPPQRPARLPPCPTGKPTGSPPAGAPVAAEDKSNTPCTEENPLQPIIASKHLPPLNSRQKGYLAARDVIDPFNLLTIVANAGVIVGANAHSAYGPGFPGFGSLIGYSLVEDMQGEFFGTYVIPSLAHQDPRYYRMPGRPVRRRILNAIEHTVITRHDDGSPMPNYATLLTFPISAELTNLYVPGVAVNAPSTVKRIGLGLASDPVGQLVAEFLPDVAKRIHIRVIFVQQILQNVAGGGTGAVATQ